MHTPSKHSSPLMHSQTELCCLLLRFSQDLFSLPICVLGLRMVLSTQIMVGMKGGGMFPYTAGA